MLFQSTRPVRGATAALLGAGVSVSISIHAPRAGRDDRVRRVAAYRQHFNPRAPCGARLISDSDRDLGDKFQSTRPVRGATRLLLGREAGTEISIHAPRAGRDV